MADHWQILFAFVLLMSIARVHSQGDNWVPLTLVSGAVQKGAVCIDGSSAGYNLAIGSGDGVNNWIIFLAGGGWCWERTCVQRMNLLGGSTKDNTTLHFAGILSSNKSINPDFYNWNRVLVRYCDGASFMGDNEANDTGTNVQLRGSKIFKSVMDELLEKGMKNANNAILSGGSAGGLATILNCDGFRALMPNVGRAKCLSDGGFFIRAKDLPFAHTREWVYAETVKFHNLSNFLPKSCTSRMDASLCLFPEYLVGDVKAPLFLLNSAFDSFQIFANMEKYPDMASWQRCTMDITNSCTPNQKQKIKDFRNAFLQALEDIGDNRSRGLLINSCYLHGMIDNDLGWSSSRFGLDNKTIAQAFADWYFDRTPIRLIDTQNDFARNCKRLNDL